MSSDLPDYYFRVRDKGAAVFRVDTENRQRRIEFEEIAFVNARNGQIRPHGEAVLSDGDTKAITDWVSARRVELLAREKDDILRAIDHLNLTTQWAQSRAEDEVLEEVTDRLLLAMHDLRSVLVRRKADRLMKEAKS